MLYKKRQCLNTIVTIQTKDNQKCLKLAGFDDMIKLNLCGEQCGEEGFLSTNALESLPLRHQSLRGHEMREAIPPKSS